jgi:hypothetical protein
MFFALFFSANLHAKELICEESAEYSDITYFLVDRSDEISATKALKRSLRIVKKTINKNSSAERLLIGVITGKSTKTRILMDRVKVANSIMESALKIRKQRRLFNKCIDRESETLTKTNEKHKRSAILETLKFVAEVLRKDPSKNKRLVIFSDMVQNSRAISFYGKHTKLKNRRTKKSPEQLVDAIDKNLVANFKNVKIYVAGTGGTVSEAKARKVEQFWRAYFKKTGGDLRFYGPLLTGLK